MAWEVTFTIDDAWDGVKQKTFGLNSADYTEAATDAVAVQTALDGIIEGGIKKRVLKEVTNVGGSPAAGSNIDEGLTLTYTTNTSGKTGTVKIPTPDKSVTVVAGTRVVDGTTTEMAAFTAALVAHCTISDGEPVVALKSGRLDS